MIEAGSIEIRNFKYVSSLWKGHFRENEYSGFDLGATDSLKFQIQIRSVFISEMAKLRG